MGISLTPYGYADWITSAKKHIYKIKKLIRDYYDLEVGVLIDKYSELLKVSNSPEVYISRRALKHFVERRSAEMKGGHEKEIILYRLYFVIDHVEYVIQTHNSLELEDDTMIYVKGFEVEFKANLRIVTEWVDDHQEIKSIHFQKNKKPPDR